MRWNDIVKVAGVRPWRAVARRPIAGTSISKAVTEVSLDAATRATAVLQITPGLVGRGRLEITTTSRLYKQQIADDLTKDGVDPTTGEPYVSIMPILIAKDWSTHRFGEWLHHYRPDLWQEANAQLAKLTKEKPGVQPPEV